MVSTQVSFAILALTIMSACSQKPADNTGAAASTETVVAEPAKPTPESIDTIDGTKLASFTGTAAAGEGVFAACKACHAVKAGQNMTGPSLHGILGRTAGTIPGYTYSVANKNSGILWTNDKMFQYLEDPQRVIPGTKMTYSGLKNPQKRADLIAYLDAQK